MATATKTGVKRTIERVKGALAEVDYAQRRLFEIRTGVPVGSADERDRPATSVDELEALYEHGQDDREQPGELAA